MPLSPEKGINPHSNLGDRILENRSKWRNTFRFQDDTFIVVGIWGHALDSSLSIPEKINKNCSIFWNVFCNNSVHRMC